MRTIMKVFRSSRSSYTLKHPFQLDQHIPVFFDSHLTGEEGVAASTGIYIVSVSYDPLEINSETNIALKLPLDRSHNHLFVWYGAHGSRYGEAVCMVS